MVVEGLLGDAGGQRCVPCSHGSLPRRRGIDGGIEDALSPARSAVSASGAVMNAESEWAGQSSLADRRSTLLDGKGKRKKASCLLPMRKGLSGRSCASAGSPRSWSPRLQPVRPGAGVINSEPRLTRASSAFLLGLSDASFVRSCRGSRCRPARSPARLHFQQGRQPENQLVLRPVAAAWGAAPGECA